MYALLKSLIKGDRKQFRQICQSNGLQLDYRKNKQWLRILKEVFVLREYADCFPFYQNSTIVDIGAHGGYFSFFASLNAQPETTIISYEPNSDNFQLFLENLLSVEFKNIKPLNLAVGGHNAMVDLFKAEGFNSSVLTQNLGASESKAFEKTQMITLEQVLEQNNLSQIDFLKIDCEGAEYQLLENTPADVFNNLRTIAMEFHDMKSPTYHAAFLISLLKKHHFDIVKFHYSPSWMGLNYGKIVATK